MENRVDTLYQLKKNLPAWEKQRQLFHFYASYVSTVWLLTLFALVNDSAQQEPPVVPVRHFQHPTALQVAYDAENVPIRP